LFGASPVLAWRLKIFARWTAIYSCRAQRSAGGLRTSNAKAPSVYESDGIDQTGCRESAILAERFARNMESDNRFVILRRYEASVGSDRSIAPSPRAQKIAGEERTTVKPRIDKVLDNKPNQGGRK